MALYEKPNASHLPTLFRLGFSARLRWELSDTFLRADQQTLSATSSRTDATFFHFQTNDVPLQAVSLLTTVQIGSSFLTLTPTVSQTQTPNLLRVSIAPNPSPSRTLVSLQRPGPAGKYLTLRNRHADLVDNLTKHCLFHLEICPDSIAKDASHPASDLRFLYPVQAFTYALLSLGVRFRLRSVHKRVLRTAKRGEKRVVLQNGPRTQLAETHDAELLFTAFKVGTKAADAEKEPRAVFRLMDVACDKALVVSQDNPQNGDTVAKLGQGDICVQYTNDWGALHIGDTMGSQWLMAGPRGRLEVRRHRGRWEAFVVEFVRQSFDMTLKELPLSEVYQQANDSTRKAVRAQIARNVAAAKGEVQEEGDAVEAKTVPIVPKKETIKSSKGGFNHAAALAGFSEPVETNENKEQSKKEAERAKAKEKEAKEAKAAAAAVAVSALPRNKANRKAAKRNKKKQQGRAVQRAASRAGAGPSRPNPNQIRPDGAVNGIASNKDDDVQDLNGTETGSSKRTAEESSTSSQSIGPPCAACGRLIDGRYTTALGKNFHPQCFCCGQCRRPMGLAAGQFRERGGIPYCESCYVTHLASKCARCSKPILDTVTTAMDKTWHKECLTCTICRLPLTQTFWLYADKPNEPRCSRCVTGSEDGLQNVRGNGRMVNLPLLGMGGNASPPSLGGTGFECPPNTAQGGRARLMTPVLPAASQR